MQSKLLPLVALAILLYVPKIIFAQAPDLGVASTFVLFTNGGAFNGDAATSVVGDIGTNAGAFTPPGNLVGSSHVPPDPVTVLVASDVSAAYADLATRICGLVLGTPFGNQTLLPNTYCLGGASVLNGTLILDGAGNPNAIFIFQIDGALSTDPLSTITLINGANLCNVYFQVNGMVSLGGNSVFQGTILAAGAIELGTGATLTGRGLTTAGAISTSANVVSLPTTCLVSLPPTITCPAPVAVTCASQVPVANPNSVVTTATCPGAVTVISLGDVISNQTCANQYTITRTYQVTDACGLTATCAQTITVNDQTVPTIACPADLTVLCVGLVPPGSNTAATTSDNCGGAVTVTFADVISNQICANRFIITRTYTATDACGNAANCAQTITVNDQTVPTIACPADLTVLCVGLVPPGSNTAATTSDNCGGAVTVTFADVISNQICANRFIITRTYTATDACGNATNCAQTITVNDQTVPTIACPADLTVLCVGLVPPGSNTAATTSDNCGGAVTVNFADVISNQICANRFTITRTYTAIDACGNAANCAQVITVNDQTVPTIACPADLTVLCVGLVPPGSNTAATTSDNCGGAVTVTFADIISNQICANRFIITRTYTATDACGNATNCAQVITVNDETVPTIACPADLTVLCVGLVPPGSNTAATTSDNCGGAVTVNFADIISNQICANRFIITRTYTATDACGNATNCAQTITVNDQTVPTIACPADLTVLCVGLVPPGSNTAATTSDNCGGAVTVTFADLISNQICANRFTITRTYTATDACSNATNCAQVITVFDNSLPIVACPANLTVSCVGLVPVASSTAVTTSDNCGGAVTVNSGDVISNQICTNRFTITRTYRADDECGNSAQCVQTITVNDQTPPTIMCPADLSVSCANQVPTANPGSVTTSDNCGGQVTAAFVSDVISNQICVDRFTITRTYSATDLCGNVSNCAQTIMVNGIMSAPIICPADVTVSCASQVPAADPASIVVGVNCGGQINVTSADVISNQICANRFTITRTYTLSDACGSMATCAQTITVFDQTPPTINCPANVSVTCAGQVPPGSNTSATTSDNCGGAVIVTFSDLLTNQICANRFTNTRTYTATDVCGNMATCAQIITVFDNTIPTIICPSNVSVSCVSQVPAANPASVIASDNCGGQVPTTVTLLSDIISNQRCTNGFTLTRTYLATDACGLTATCVQPITVNDQTLPTITCPANVSVSCASQVPVANTTAPTTSDNCGGAVAVTSNDVLTNQICTNRFTNTRTYTATDACGNIANCAQIITVLDNILPVINCPANVSVSCASQVPTASTTAVTTSDNCGGAVVVTLLGDVISNQLCANRFTITRTYLATDACGNTATCAQIITVFDQTLPTIVCPANVTVSCVSQLPAPNPASVTTTDNCGGQVGTTFISDVISNQICANRFTATRSYRATDICGNTASCAQIITVFDNILPTVICPANISVSCANTIPAVNPAIVIANDNCGGAATTTLLSDVISNQICANQYILTRTYVAADLCGNFANCVQTITVNDQTAPILTCPANVSVSCINDLPVPTPATLVATDLCGGAATLTYLGDVTVATICPSHATVTRTYQATDLCGNFATCVQTITVNDQTPPVVICPADISVSCSAQMPPSSPASVAVMDACSGGVLSTVVLNDVISNQICESRYLMTRTYQSSDVCGNTFNCVQLITVNDQTGPIFTVLPQNMIVECSEGLNTETQMQNWLTNFGGAQITGQCGANGTITTQTILLSDVPGCGVGSSTFTRTYQFIATDGCGNTSSVTATFSLIDNTPPFIKCPPGNLLLTCEHDLPLPDMNAVQAWDACGGNVKLMLTISTNGTGCANWMRSTNYWFMATDECGNMSNCDQSFQIRDTFPPVYTGPDTINVSCINDLPGTGDITNILAPYMTDNCYDVICFGRVSSQNGPNSITYRVKAKDYCGNWSYKFNVTFVATGVCRPLCTTSQAMWGSQDGIINTMSTSEAIDTFISQHGGITAGKLGKTYTATSTDCLQHLLPGNGPIVQFSPGQHTFGAANDCNPSSPLVNPNGTLKNALAANVMAMQMNIWYNLKFNDRALGVQRLANLPGCLIDNVVLEKLETDHNTVQGLLNMSNDYLAGVGFFPPGFGDLLSDALDNLNRYWQNCQINDPCTAQRSEGLNNGNNQSHLSLAPNPVLDIALITLDVPADAELRVRFVNSVGAIQMEDVVQVVKGSNTLSFSTKNFPAGMYTVVVQQGKDLQALRMVKVKD